MASVAMSAQTTAADSERRNPASLVRETIMKRQADGTSSERSPQHAASCRALRCSFRAGRSGKSENTIRAYTFALCSFHGWFSVHEGTYVAIADYLGCLDEKGRSPRGPLPCSLLR